MVKALGLEKDVRIVAAGGSRARMASLKAGAADDPKPGPVSQSDGRGGEGDIFKNKE